MWHVVSDKKITIEEGAELLHLKRRQVKRCLKKGVREQGDAFVIHIEIGQEASSCFI